MTNVTPCRSRNRGKRYNVIPRYRIWKNENRYSIRINETPRFAIVCIQNLLVSSHVLLRCRLYLGTRFIRWYILRCIHGGKFIVIDRYLCLYFISSIDGDVQQSRRNASDPTANHLIFYRMLIWIHAGASLTGYKYNATIYKELTTLH